MTDGAWWKPHEIALAVAGTSVVAAVALTTYQVYAHLANYTIPHLQKHIVRLLLMVPIYAIDSLLSLWLIDYALYFDAIRDCYEAFALYQFFRLLLNFLESHTPNFYYSMELKPARAYPIPLCCLKYQPGSYFITICKQMILQFVILKPLCAVITIVLELLNVYDEGSFSPTSGYLYITVIDNVSITVALFYLLCFYEACAEELKPFRPFGKFLCIKGVVFFAFWQGVIIAILAHFNVLHEFGSWTAGNVSTGLQDFVVCIEMFFFALAFGYAFGVSRYLADNVTFNAELNAIRDVWKLHHHVPHLARNLNPLLKNFADIANPHDVARETLDAYGRLPRRFVMLGDFYALPRDQQLARVIKSGWLAKEGEIIRNWKTRFFVLLSKPCGLIYFEHDPFVAAPGSEAAAAATDTAELPPSAAGDSDSLPPPSQPTTTTTTTTANSDALADRRPAAPAAPPPGTVESLENLSALLATSQPPSDADTASAAATLASGSGGDAAAAAPSATTTTVEASGAALAGTSMRNMRAVQPQLTAASGALRFQPLGFIDFNLVTEVRAEVLSDVDFRVHLVTPERTWVLRAQHQDAQEDWLEAFRGTLDMLQRQEVDIGVLSEDEFLA